MDCQCDIFVDFHSGLLLVGVINLLIFVDLHIFWGFYYKLASGFLNQVTR